MSRSDSDLQEFFDASDYVTLEKGPWAGARRMPVDFAGFAVQSGLFEYVWETFDDLKERPDAEEATYLLICIMLSQSCYTSHLTSFAPRWLDFIKRLLLLK